MGDNILDNIIYNIIYNIITSTTEDYFFGKMKTVNVVVVVIHAYIKSYIFID